MKLQTQIFAHEEAKEVVERLTALNVEKKLSSYLSKYDKDDAEWLIKVKVDKNSRWLFDGSLNVTLDGKWYDYSREDYKKLDDLVNNLFDHLKEELANQKERLVSRK